MYTIIGLVLIILGVLIALITTVMNLSLANAQGRSDIDDATLQLLNDGMACLKKNDMPGAIENLSRYSERDPDNEQCHEYLGFAYAQGGHYHLARKHAEIALRHSDAYFSLIANAMYYRYKLDIRKSLDEARKAIAVSPDIYHGHYWAGMAYANLFDFGRALAECDIVRRHDQDAADCLQEYIRDLKSMTSGKEESEPSPAGGPGVRDYLDVSFSEITPEDDDAAESQRSQHESGRMDHVLNDYPEGDDRHDPGEPVLDAGSVRVSERNRDLLARRDCLVLLEVGPSASQKDIKEAYRKLVKVWHPDRFSHDPALQEFAQDRLSRIVEAYRYLTA